MIDSRPSSGAALPTNPASDVGVVIAAGGSGRRFGAAKQFLEVLGRPLLFYSLDAFCGVGGVAELVVVVPVEALASTESLLRTWREASPWTAPVAVRVVRGGARRQDSVLQGLEALSERVEWSLVHDAARPLVLPADVERLLSVLRDEGGAAALGQPSYDSVKVVRDGLIVEELPRDEVWTVQTPQGARRRDLLLAYRAAGAAECTDEATALRANGTRVRLVEGSSENIKVTRLGDEIVAARILEARLR